MILRLQGLLLGLIKAVPVHLFRLLMIPFCDTLPLLCLHHDFGGCFFDDDDV
eukprot:10152.XXX_212168_212323_1 [CDS] Oithona nana genome sequencing.